MMSSRQEQEAKEETTVESAASASSEQEAEVLFCFFPFIRGHPCNSYPLPNQVTRSKKTGGGQGLRGAALTCGPFPPQPIPAVEDDATPAAAEEVNVMSPHRDADDPQHMTPPPSSLLPPPLPPTASGGLGP
jgi:hypothetical protein